MRIWLHLDLLFHCWGWGGFLHFMRSSEDGNEFLMKLCLQESSSPHWQKLASGHLFIWLYTYIYLYSFHNKYTMAFKIKSAKIFLFFFWNKRTHSDVVVGCTLILAQTDWAATGHQQEEETRRRHAYILPDSWQRSHWEGQLSITWRRRSPGRERQQSSATGRQRSPWWCDCQDFLVNF